MPAAMRRANRSVAVFCIAAIVLAAFAPGLGLLATALCEPVWELLPDEVVIAVAEPVDRTDEQPAALLSLLSPRAPPAASPA